ncbi:MAG: hypothetical protein IIB13_07385, partial [Chloroflexi bacterium]|nr:hypothetical protein [Chloroflexota bacterium]
VWVIPLLTAIGGAAVALIGREIIEWYKRPRLEIDFEKREGQNPYIPDLNDETRHEVGYTLRIKYFRLKVRNKGKKPAMNCEAKLEIIKVTTKDIESDITSTKVALHWLRNDPILFSQNGDIKTGLLNNAEKVFAPINLNINDAEIVEVFRLPYLFSTKPDTNHTPNPHPFIESASLRQLQLQPNWSYQGKVTVYASNANPESFKLKIKWDGKVEGFDKAFTKV